MTESIPNIISVATQEIVAQARSLGLTWLIQIATVSASSATSGTTIVFDGDTVSISATNITGERLAGGDRVYVIAVPQSGNFIVGFAELMLGGLLGRVDSSTVNVADNTAELVILTTPVVTFTNRRAFRISYRLSTSTAGGANNQALVRVREGTGTGGTVWNSANYTNLNGFNPEARFGEFYVKNGSGTTFGSTITLTAVAVISIHVAVVSSTTDVAFLEVTDAGPASDYTNALEIS